MKVTFCTVFETHFNVLHFEVSVSVEMSSVTFMLGKFTTNYSYPLLKLYIPDCHLCIQTHAISHVWYSKFLHRMHIMNNNTLSLHGA